jgi:hypothetical protein
MQTVVAAEGVIDGREAAVPDITTVKPVAVA